MAAVVRRALDGGRYAGPAPESQLAGAHTRLALSLVAPDVAPAASLAQNTAHAHAREAQAFHAARSRRHPQHQLSHGETMDLSPQAANREDCRRPPSHPRS